MLTQKTLIFQRMIAVMAFFMIHLANAGIPLWSIIPAPGNHPTQTVPVNITVNIQYTVQNQSNNTYTLVIKPTQGITQAAPCQLARSGQAGSSCTLSLNITGSALPPEGVHAGPVLCAANPDGSPNINLCYQPSPVNRLNITRGAPVLALISITSPVQQNRIVGVGSTALSLQITNDNASLINANAITVSDKGTCPDLVVDDSDCVSVAPNDHCTLEIESPTPYTPCTITISGNNTANSPQTLIAFSYSGGLVFDVNGTVYKMVLDADEPPSLWTGSTGVIPFADSPDDGFGNTEEIVADPLCSSDPANCAAQKCRDIAPDLYLPAINELSSIRNAFCSNNAIPCHFGGFASGNYWSSTQNGGLEAVNIQFPSGDVDASSKTGSHTFRCVREIIG